MGAHGACDGMVAAHHHQRLLHGLLIEAAGLLKPAPQAQHRLFIEDGDRITRLALEDDEADGIGAEVDDSAAG